ncbi:hypothetical protein Kpol_1029p4 [Vanderwaltozyma polyspora DSM 70294]|uniref:phosphoinositide 5-phosphatase n=1 Tax=Vanderwaltozyma polyspora (strain ATCC 22028 / DSM 70294 / BCRC 21397 / CBS 2163 / NBRC 10782 / NRRL Y-8283 / UCD 57-17) TaxID=436907 RepID=A7TR63_VANPO|nr:uncharacterized protein Kpol_1029p4 [Vanderwaltozyma polyspora DSM 70294]EDO15231.1 hypothetical protein Kpol_1029p4 [Vanderwaltozyma polyspora DSM 70294]
MIILVSQNSDRRVAIVSETFALVFKAISRSKKDSNPSNNKRSLCAIELLPKKDLTDQGFKRLSGQEIHGFIGLIEIDGLVFIGTITGKSKVAQPIPHETVNKIHGVDFFCLNDSRWDFVEIDSSGYPVISEAESMDRQDSVPRHPCYEIRKLLSNGSFYYSSDFDLTSSLQNRGFSEHSLSSDNFEQEYMWNSFLMQEVITYRDRLDTTAKQILDDEGFLTTVIRGFAETFITYVKRLKVGLTIISKQSWKRAGTRFNARGIDDEANVANFVETELIMYSNQYCYSFTQIRGSVPVFWEQDTALINPKVSITRSLEATQPVFDDHFIRLTNKYGPVHVVNLLSTKASEIELSQRYRKHLTKSTKVILGRDTLLTEFDFHKETAQEGFSGSRKLLPLIIESLLANGYFSYDVKEKRIISEQQGVFRTNCLDCLDRTNLVQQMVSLCAFKTFLEDFEMITAKSFIDEDDFVNKHNGLWADHGDQISQIYTGTNALKSSFSRKGKMSLAGALSDATKSVSRMYINNFMDKGKQQNIDALLGRLPHQQAVELYDPINEFVTSELNGLSEQFTSYSTANLFVGTFNVNGTSKRADLSKWLFPIGDKFKPDIVVLGLQEVIELTAGSILNADYSKGSFWERMVSDCLNQFGEKYLLLRVEQMSSLIILFFVKADKANNVKQVEGASKKTGFGGMTGNKGAVAIRFDYGSTSFCFVNAHFSAGSTNIDERRNDFESIFKNISFTRSKAIQHHDSIFWLGDLNYRITLVNEEVRRELSAKREGYIDTLLKYDQLTQEINAGVVFQGFKEPTLKFRPTYKYDNGTDNYDSSEKARTPSWTDRIIYKGDNLHPLAYSDAHLLISDHRPVYAAYRSKITFIDEEVKLKLTNKLYNDYKAAHPEDIGGRNHRLVDLDLDNSSAPKKSESSLPQLKTDSLLDLDKPATITQSPISHTPSLNSLNSVPLQPASRKASSGEIAKPAIRAPPPPAPRSVTSTPIHKAMSSTDLGTSSSLDMRTPPPRKSTSPPPPIVPSARKVLPPGFTEAILTPKSTSSSLPLTKSPDPISRKTPPPPPKHHSSIVSPPPASATKIEKVKNDGKDNSQDAKPNTQASEEHQKKVPPSVPNKKPELEGLTMDSWKPLTPK